MHKIIVLEKPSLKESFKKNLKNLDISYVCLRGHIKQWIFPELKWTKQAIWEIYGLEPKRIIKDQESYNQLKYVVNKYSNEELEVILALDPDTEGNIIAYDVFTCLEENAKKITFSRMLIEDTNSILEAYNTRKEFDKTAHYYGYYRSKIDLLYGSIFTRFLTSKYKTFLSAGRVQTPILKLIFEKELEIRAFKKESFKEWSITNGNKTFILEQCMEPIVLDSVKVIPAKPQDVVLKGEEYGYNTDTLTNDCLKLKLKKEKINKLLEQLYLAGYCTYPRTTNNSYYKYPLVWTNLKKLLQISKTKEIKRDNKKNPDHAPITILRLDYKDRDKDQRQILTLLEKRGKQVLAKHNEYLKHTLEVTYQKDGSKKIKTYAILELIKKHCDLDISSIKLEFLEKPFKLILKEKETTPPPRYSVSTLLATLVKKHLGTKSTRLNIVNLLEERLFIEYKKNYSITLAGRYILKELQDLELSDTQYTMKLEKNLINFKSIKQYQQLYNEIKQSIGIKLKKNGYPL